MTASNEAPRPRHRIRSHLYLLDIDFSCCAPRCPACKWDKAHGGWIGDDSMREYLDGMR